MTDIDRIEERLTAVERTVVDGDYELDELADVAALTDQFEEFEERLAEVEDRLAKLEGRSQALGGYVSNVQSVNDDVDDKASAALATVDRLEDRLAELEQATNGADERRPSSNDTTGGRSAEATRTRDATQSSSPSTAGSSVSDTVNDLFPDDTNASGVGAENTASVGQQPGASGARTDAGGRQERGNRAAGGTPPRGTERTPPSGPTGTQHRSDASSNEPVDASNGHRSDAHDRSRADRQQVADDRAIEQQFGEENERDESPEDAVNADGDDSDDDDGFLGSLRSSLS